MVTPTMNLVIKNKSYFEKKLPTQFKFELRTNHATYYIMTYYNVEYST